jgi:hypothetical protein
VVGSASKQFNHAIDESNPKVRSGALKRRICEIIERLTVGFTAVAFSFYFSSTGLNYVLFQTVQRNDCRNAGKQAQLYAFAPGFHQWHELEQ